jgi:hypothetical protein
MRSLSSVCDDPEPQVAHRALVCAASARHRMPTSSTTTLSVIRRPAAARERARRPWSAGWHKNTHRTPPRSAMAFRARCIPTFSTRLRPPSLPHHHLATSARPSPAMQPSQEQARNMLRVRPRASGSTFSACVSAYSVEPEPLLWCTLVMTCLFCGPVLTRKETRESLTR